MQQTAVVVVHSCDELAEGSADELLAVGASPDEVRGSTDEAADRQAQCELSPWVEREQCALDGAAARQCKP